MPIPILMPALSPTMTEGNLARWLKREGEAVHSGDVLAEIETDKATMEVEAIDDGRIGRLLVPEGAQGIKVNQPIAVLLGEDEDESALDTLPVAKPAEPAPQPPPQPLPQPSLAEATPAPPPPGATPAPPPPARERGDGRIFASPLARRMAQQAGLDLGALTGSGPQGRIIKADIEAALSRGRPAALATPRPLPPTPAAARPQPAQSKEQVFALAGNPPYSERPHSAMRRTIARRLTESKQTIPHFYLSIDCQIDALLKIRAELNAKLAPSQPSPATGGGQGGGKISVNDFVIRAAALALRQVPAANASWTEEAILLWDAVDVAVAVALDDGLITPIVRRADQKGLATIAQETRDLVARARAGKLKLEEFQGGTFSISNLGMYGIREFAAVINPPQGAILAVGAGEPRPVAKDGGLIIATVMTCTLSCDHRVVDGAVGAQFLAAFKKLVEDPLTMLL
jgi:pyruvate dehydrogenase E2 component (dihydrolipoamide acetyltransferase)